MSGNLIRHKATCATNATGHSLCDCAPDLIPIRAVVKCRCGYETDGDDGKHPCHGRDATGRPYSCRKPAQHRFYNARPVALAGMQLKFGVNDTFACDECWDKFNGKAT